LKHLQATASGRTAHASPATALGRELPLFSTNYR
jgi:hypothetical protein